MNEILLSEILEITKDGEWGKGEADGNSVPMRVIRGTDFAAARYGDLSTVPLRHIESKTAARKCLKPGDILIETAGGTKDQPTGRTVLLKNAVFENSDSLVTCASFSRFLRVKSDLVRPDYLFWYLQHLYKSGLMYPYHVQHTGVARFQYTQFATQTRIPIRDLRDQDALCKILNALDDKIDLNRRMNETLRSIARAIFKHWFVDFGPIRAKAEGRVPANMSAEILALFPDDLDAERKPLGWDLSRIGDEVKAVGGGTPSTTVAEYWEGGEHSWATPKDLSNLDAPVLLQTSRKLTLAGIAKVGSGILPAGSVLLSSRAPIGYLAISEIPVAVNQGFIAMVCEKRLSNLFVLLWCMEHMSDILSQANGSTFQEISKTNFRPLPMVVPERRVLDAFDGIVRPLYNRIVCNLHSNETLATARDYLLRKFMLNQIAVRDESALLEACT